MKQFILSSIFIFISITIFSQNLHNLNGKVTNEKNGQVTVGDVLLLHLGTRSPYTRSVTCYITCRGSLHLQM